MVSFRAGLIARSAYSYVDPTPNVLTALTGYFALTGEDMTPITELVMQADSSGVTNKFVLAGQSADLVSPTPSEDAATTAWVNAVIAAGGTVSTTQRGRVDTLITAYKAAGVWALLDHEWLFASENAKCAQVDIVGLASHTLVAIPTSPTFTAHRGYQTPLEDGYIDLGFAPSGAVNYQQNAASFGAYVLTNRTAGTSNGLMGTTDGSGNYSFVRANNSNTLEHDLNSSSFNAPANSTAMGNYIFSRTNSTTIVPYKNNAALATGTTGAAGARSTRNWFVFTFNTNGVPNTITDDAIASVFTGGSLTGTQALAKNAALNAYMTSEGCAVY